MTIHVVGAGLAGLAAAAALTEAGLEVEVSEAAAQAGGRCRSYFDAQLGLTIDNGNHMVLSGNPAVAQYLAMIGAQDRLAGPATAEFAFLDLRNGKRWTVRPNKGPLPWWIFSRARGVPQARLSDYLALAPLLRAKPHQRIGEVIPCRGPVWDRLFQPILLAALNIAPEKGSAALAGQVLRETVAKGAAAYAPRIPHPSLAAAFVEPAVDHLARQGAALRLQRRLTRITSEAGRVRALEFSDGPVELGRDDAVVLAAPPWVATQLLPGLEAPDAFESILNGHFRTAPPQGAPMILGVLGGMAEWIFCFPDRISVTVSGANHLIQQPREALAARLWADVAAALGLGPDLPPWQVVKEKRATFEATVEQERLRPGARTALANLVLAGDWTDTGLPGTIEGALRSGFRAAEILQAHILPSGKDHR
ncbi:MAG TPA: hydroxysqualene dehydroxylase HpnE [Phenylobacterium sp.]|uniref:hydroxysqualene dehydroxylase HpnE n=1 Tax=Phenylobacterium sp. TaxID=1871053 RepID=UPI002B477597|nr:hydroxysqualene dehydroxylase HpnE [Phenylobacterium sp.]HKR87590.1 hydroxysqualene dehydroxylase HpnE [Phenylobacterium sp.]